MENILDVSFYYKIIKSCMMKSYLSFPKVKGSPLNCANTVDS